MTTAVNAIQSSSHPGQSDQTGRIQAFVNAEIASFPAGTNLSVNVTAHRDDKSSRTCIVVQVAKLNANGEVLSVP